MLHRLFDAYHEGSGPSSHIVPSQHAAHAWYRQRRARIDAGQARMGVRRTHDGRMQGTGLRTQIIRELAAPCQQGVILQPLQGLAYARLCLRYSARWH